MRKKPVKIGISSDVEGIDVRLYANAIELKTNNGRKIIEQTKENPDNCILVIKTLLPKEKIASLRPGQYISCIETVEKGILEVSMGLTLKSLKALHLIIGMHLEIVGEDPIDFIMD